SGPPPRNWKGIGIAMLVIVVVLSSVIASVILLTPDETKTPRKSRLSIENLNSEEFQVLDPKPTWINDEDVILQTTEGHVIQKNIKTGQAVVLVDNSTFCPLKIREKTKAPPRKGVSFTYIFSPHQLTLKATKFQVSPDLKYVLLAYNVQQVFRYSFLASYAVYNIRTREVSDLNPPEVQRTALQYAAWGPQGNQLLACEFLYVFENNIYYQHEVAGSALRLTSSGRDGVVLNGIPDWLYEEEVLQSHVALWWSSDGARLAYLTINDSSVPNMELPQFLGSLYPASKHYPYPKAGQPIAEVKLCVVNLYGPAHTLELVPPDTFRFREYYISMVMWVSSTRLAVRWLNRAQNSSILAFCEATTGACAEKHKITTDAWIIKKGRLEPEVSEQMFSFFLDIIAQQVLTGPLFLFSELQLLPRPEWLVPPPRSLLYHNAIIIILITFISRYFLSTEDAPRKRHLYSVETTGIFNRVCVTCGQLPNCSFFHVQFSPNQTYFMLHCRGPGFPRITIHRTADPSDYYILEDNQKLRNVTENKHLPNIEYESLRVDGFDLPIKLSLPDDYQEKLQPLLLIVEGAPGSQSVTEEFSLCWDTVLVSSFGAIVARLDGRGTGHQGLRLLHEVNRKLGSLEVKDHVAALEWLLQLPYVDQRRIGIYGKGYGGYLTLKLLAATDRLFKCGVAVSPVTDFKLYASAFSERHLGLPSREDTAYTVSLPLKALSTVENEPMFCIKAAALTSVHFQHTAELLNRLIKADANFTTQIYPDENHEFVSEWNVDHLQRTVLSYFRHCFQGHKRRRSEPEDED
uniref:Dipeptidyl peptidase like 10 n=1 Tax=Latimeria chalumnae TaxID=7897 RepID=H3B4G8_LATCH